MSIFNYFYKEDKSRSASVAKERLQVIVAHERTKRKQPDFLPKMQNEILQVIRKYIEIDMDDVNIQLEDNNECSVLELNITLPDR